MNLPTASIVFPSTCSRCIIRPGTKTWQVSTSTSFRSGSKTKTTTTYSVKVPICQTCIDEVQEGLKARKKLTTPIYIITIVGGIVITPLIGALIISLLSELLHTDLSGASPCLFFLLFLGGFMGREIGNNILAPKLEKFEAKWNIGFVKVLPVGSEAISEEEAGNLKYEFSFRNIVFKNHEYQEEYKEPNERRENKEAVLNFLQRNSSGYTWDALTKDVMRSSDAKLIQLAESEKLQMVLSDLQENGDVILHLGRYITKTRQWDGRYSF